MHVFTAYQGMSALCIQRLKFCVSFFYFGHLPAHTVQAMLCNHRPAWTVGLEGTLGKVGTSGGKKLSMSKIDIGKKDKKKKKR